MTDIIRIGLDTLFQLHGVDAAERPVLRKQLRRGSRTQLANAIRGFAAEFGLTAAKGMCRVEPLLERIAVDEAHSGTGTGAICASGPRIRSARTRNRGSRS